MDVLLNELVQSLDEDLADLDEYEQGLEFPLDTTYVLYSIYLLFVNFL